MPNDEALPERGLFMDPTGFSHQSKGKMEAASLSEGTFWVVSSGILWIHHFGDKLMRLRDEKDSPLSLGDWGACFLLDHGAVVPSKPCQAKNKSCTSTCSRCVLVVAEGFISFLFPTQGQQSETVCNI